MACPMFSFNRNEQIALLLLSAALIIGGIITYIDSRNSDAIPDFDVQKSAVPLPDTSVQTAHKGPMDINRATVQELQQLPGIGPQIAQRIVDHRNLHGPFATAESLTAVRGIGEKTLERIKPHIVVIAP